MALKPTIFKAGLQVADSDRHHYQTYALTLAQHPSETLERMLVRLLCFALHASERVEFTKGLSSVDEPDVWEKSDDGVIQLWIEAGQPKPERIKKALGLARQVRIFAFGKTCDTWWQLEGKDMPDSERLKVYKLPWSILQVLAEKVTRNIDWSVSITGGEIYLDDGQQNCVISLQQLSL